MKSGTPATLDQAIENAIMMGPLKEMQMRLYINTKDFLAQRFQSALCNCESKEEEDKLMKLFYEIIKQGDGR